MPPIIIPTGFPWEGLSEASCENLALATVVVGGRAIRTGVRVITTVLGAGVLASPLGVGVTATGVVVGVDTVEEGISVGIRNGDDVLIEGVGDGSALDRALSLHPQSIASKSAGPSRSPSPVLPTRSMMEQNYRSRVGGDGAVETKIYLHCELDGRCDIMTPCYY